MVSNIHMVMMRRVQKFIDFVVPLPKAIQNNKNINLEIGSIVTLLNKFGESSYDVCLIFYLSQYETYFSPRQLKRKLHEYALFKTDKDEKNIFLMMSIMFGATDLSSKFEGIIAKLYNLYGGNKALTFKSMSNLEFNELSKIFEVDLQLKDSVILSIIESHRLIFNRYSNQISPDPKPIINKELTKVYSEYALNPLNEYQDISKQFEMYLKVNLPDSM